MCNEVCQNQCLHLFSEEMVAYLVIWHSGYFQSSYFQPSASCWETNLRAGVLKLNLAMKKRDTKKMDVKLKLSMRSNESRKWTRRLRGFNERLEWFAKTEAHTPHTSQLLQGNNAGPVPGPSHSPREMEIFRVPPPMFSNNSNFKRYWMLPIHHTPLVCDLHSKSNMEFEHFIFQILIFTVLGIAT